MRELSFVWKKRNPAKKTKKKESVAAKLGLATTLPVDEILWVFIVGC